MLSGCFFYSTTFSGMGTPEHALNILSHELRRHGIEFSPRPRSTCDVDRTCQQLCHRFHCCCFGDICSLTKSKFKTTRHSRLSVHARMKRAVQNNARGRLAHCTYHRRHCPVPVGDDCLIGGTSCVDFSNAGKRRRLLGPTFPSTLAFAALASSRDVNVHENVKGFPDIFEQHMPHRVHKLSVAPAQFGRTLNSKP
jgi:site-specific DNA-cytosine methylase